MVQEKVCETEDILSGIPSDEGKELSSHYDLEEVEGILD